MVYPTLDAHAHVALRGNAQDLEATGAVLAMTLSLEEAALAAGRREAGVTWGVGCHPRFAQAQHRFDAARFRELAQRTAVAGEVGLDTGSLVPLELQLSNFRQILGVIAEIPRLTSIHSYRATALVLQELRRTPIHVPVLHWWTGSAEETSQAVELGCYFSIHSAVARQSKFRTRVPRDRILVESDHGYNDPPAAIPCRIQWVEYLVAQQLNIPVDELRELAWRNLAAVIDHTDTAHLLPDSFAEFFSGSRARAGSRPLQQELPAGKPMLPE